MSGAWSHEQLLVHLTDLLRKRLPQDSPLLVSIGDYDLLYQLAEGKRESAAVFDLFTVAYEALKNAKALYPPHADLHVALSIKPGTLQYWRGNRKIIESLFRNLLLLSLARTRHGLVCLRIEHENNRLNFKLDDSADNTGLFDDSVTLLMIKEIIHHLHGMVHFKREKHSHFAAGAFQLEPTQGPDLIYAQTLCDADSYSSYVLMVEHDVENSKAQHALFENAGFSVFPVNTASQALEWSAVLPFSLIVIDGALPDMSGPELAERLNRMMRDGLLHEIPIIALTSNDLPEMRAQWNKAGIEVIWTKPLRAEYLQTVFQALPCITRRFYAARDAGTWHDITATLGAKVQTLDMKLVNEIKIFCERFRNKDSAAATMCFDAHSIKSASLSLGYYRLAGCMAAIEHSLWVKDHLLNDENRQHIAESLEQALFDKMEMISYAEPKQV